MAIAAQEGSQEVPSVDIERKPLLSFRAILLMNFGFFGIQYSFGLQQTGINPIYQFLGADPAQLPLLNLAGPVTGLLIQPLIGAMSDRTWSDRWGRRKPYFLLGAIGCSICLFLWPFVFALWMAFIPLAARRLQQHGDGAIQGLHLRQAARVPAGPRLPDAGHVRRRRRCDGKPFALRVPAADRRCNRSRHPLLGVLGVLHRLGLLDRHGADLRPHDRGDSPDRGGARRAEGQAERS